MPRNGDFEKQLERGKITERQIAEYLKTIGYHVLPTTDFSARGAPKLEADFAERSLVMPDLQAFTKGQGEWFESKLKSRATATDRKRGLLVTGVDGIAWERYCDIEVATEMPVAIVFVHELEREVRCGVLAQLFEIESHRTDRMGKGGMVFWDYARIPLWMPLDELEANVTAQRLGAKLIEPSKPPIVRQLLKQNHAIRRHGLNREPSPSRAPALEPPPIPATEAARIEEIARKLEIPVEELRRRRTKSAADMLRWLDAHDVLKSTTEKRTCEHCSRVVAAAECVYSVGKIGDDADRHVLCVTCWHDGVVRPTPVTEARA